MRIHTKLIIQTCILLLIGVTLFSIYVKLEFKKNTVLFQSQRDDIESTFNKVVNLKSKTLETIAIDYTFWDEMVNYIKSPDETWAEQNLGTVIPIYGADMLAVYKSDFSSVSHFNSSGNDDLYGQFSRNVKLPEVFERKKVNHFFIHGPKGVMEVYGASVHPTGDPERKTRPQGYFFIVRLWNKQYVEEISKISDCSLEVVYPVSKTTLLNKTRYREEAIQFSSILRRWDDLPVARIDVMRISPAILEFKSASRKELILLVLFVLFIALVYIRFILRWVYDPLLLISRALKNNDLHYILKMQLGNNEFAEIARLIFKFSENKIQLAKEIELLKSTESQLEKERDRVQEYLDVAGVMLMILDKDANISMINKKGCNILGYDENEIIGKNWFQTCMPDNGKEDIRVIFSELISGSENSREYHENYVLGKGGRLRMLAFHNAVLKNKNSEIIGVLVSGEDITGRKQAEEALRKVTEELRMIIDSSQIMIIWKDREGRFVLVNKAFTEKTGLSKEYIEGKTIFELFPAYADKYWADDLEVMADNRRKLDTLEHVETDKGLVWLRTDKIPYVDQGGNVIGVVSFSLDVTKLREAEEKLKESEERYRVLFNGSYDALMTLDPVSFKFTSGNAAAIRLFGLRDEAEFISLCPCDISPEIQPDGQISKEKAQQLWEITLREGRCYFEWVHRRKDGTEFPCSVLLSMLTFGDKKIIHANVRDITESKRIEEELSRKTELLESQKEASPDGLLVVDENGQKALVNKRLIELWNLPKEIADDKNDESLLRFVMDKVKDPQKFLDKVNYLYAHRDEKSRDEVEFKSGTIFDRYSSPVIDKKGKYFGRIWIFRDITELKQAEQELKKDLHDLEVFYKASIGREERILELKKKIRELEKKLGIIR